MNAPDNQKRGQPGIDVEFVKRAGWLAAALPDRIRPPTLPIHALVEERARFTEEAGERPLWEGYKAVAGYPRATEGGRSSAQVRTQATMGKLFSWLAKERNPAHVVEFGTAFGVSGMYWLAGMETGHLHTFEPNPDWAEFAKANLSAISPRFTLTSGTFEDQGPRVLQPGSVDIAFIDAIHTSEFVVRQYEVLKPLMAPGSLILFDDLLFSQDMTDCFDRIAREPHLTASARLGRRVGVIELP